MVANKANLAKKVRFYCLKKGINIFDSVVNFDFGWSCGCFGRPELVMRTFQAATIQSARTQMAQTIWARRVSKRPYWETNAPIGEMHHAPAPAAANQRQP